ncbi:MAG TPA: type II CAAX endopeptidase family protein [Acidimicrobiales bacterium]|nr:type II CAAX endopeptidase family protein [Acidimicrobiales bacterium]
MEEPRPWGLGQALIGYAVAFVVSNLAVGLYAGAAGVDLAHPTLGVAVVGLVALWVGLFGAVLFTARRLARSSLREEFGLALRPVDVPVGIVVGLLSQIVLVWLVYLPWRAADPDLNRKLEEPAKELTNLAHGPGFVLLAVLITVGTPIVEELFFRGLLQRSLLKRMRPPAAIGLSALAFGLAHQQVLQLPGLIAFGVVLGVLAHRTGRLGPGIVAHAAFNLVTVVALAMSRG